MNIVSATLWTIALVTFAMVEPVNASSNAVRPMSLDDIERWPADATDAAISDDGSWFFFKKRLHSASEAEILHVQEINGSRDAKIADVVRYALTPNKLIVSRVDSTLEIRHFRNLGAKATVHSGVVEWSLDPSRRWLAWVTRSSTGRATAWVQDVESQTKPVTLLSTNESLKKLQWNADGTALNVYASHAGLGAPEAGSSASRLYLIQRPTSASATILTLDAQEVLKSATHEWDSSYSPRWLVDGSGIVLGIHNKRPPAPERADQPWVVVWHGKAATNPWQKSYEAAAGWVKPQMVLFNFDSKSALKLTTNEFEKLFAPLRPKNWVMLLDTKPYARYANMTGDWQGDLYAIDLRTGERKLLLRRVKDQTFAREFWGSPDGERVIYWRDRQFHIHDIESGVTRNLTAKLPTSFIDRFNDRGKIDPPVPLLGYRGDGSYLRLGWSNDSSHVLLNDGKDLWKVSVETGQAKNLTQAGGEGLEWHNRVQVVSEEAAFDSEDGIDLSRPLYVAPFDPRTKRTGLARIDVMSESLEMLRFEEGWFTNWFTPLLMKARNAEVFVHHYERADMAPGYYVSGNDFRRVRRLTGQDVEEFRRGIAWSPGSIVLEYMGSDGQPLTATLYLPAGYEKGRRYPTIVEVYERTSIGRFIFATPSYFLASRSFYTSNGYAVLRPDFTYEMNDAMVSAAKYVQLALKKAIDSGVVDAERVGLTGQSFGGYETNFIITQTGAFKAAIASAGGANMFRYNMLRGYGQPISAGSDYDQMRLRGPVDTTTIPAFLKNSAVFHADKVRTPLLLINNDGDASVNWQEGLEYFNALRRHDKNVILLQYVGEGHSPPFANKANERDLGMRIKQFWDHHLKGAEAPDWIREPIKDQRLPEYFPQ